MTTNQENKAPFAVSSKSFTAVAVNTAARAGEWIKSKLGDFSDMDLKSSQHDLVTEVDKGSEAMIRKLIQTYFPAHSFLGEEGAEQGEGGAQRSLESVKDAEFVWIVDPIDGTTNFVHGFPFFSVSIALAHKGEVIVGVVYDPSKDEMFVAEKGKGAYLRGRRIHVSHEEKLAQSLVATGLPVDRDYNLPANLREIGALAPEVRNLRIAGSAALHLAYVAAGRLSGFWEHGLNAWDIAAGALLVQEAGGTVSDINGTPYRLSVRDVAASNGAIHGELQAKLAEARIAR